MTSRQRQMDPMQQHQLARLKQCIETYVMPHPGSGQTRVRWQSLAQVAASDLNTVKWFESHADALSILYELNVAVDEQSIYAVWAAEGGPQPLQVEHGKCTGIKPWCSGAGVVDQALMTYRNAAHQSQLILVDLHHANIEIDHSHWQAVGMKHTATAHVHFHEVPMTDVAEPNAYLTRPGFWHGAAGIAACWYGATAALAQTLYQQLKYKPHPYKAMYLGEISTALHLNRHYFHQLAEKIDRFPQHSHEYEVRMLRQFTEQSARLVMDRVGLALGAAPFCQDASFAQRMTDLSVFLRQAHAAFDLEHIGQLAITQEESQWSL